MLQWQGDEHVVIGDTRLLTMGRLDSGLDPATIYEISGWRSTSDRLVMLKTRRMIEYYVEVLEGLRPERVLELGIAQGGSVALVAETVAPERLVALDVVPEPVPALEEWIAAHTGPTHITTYYGVDQTDSSALDRIADRDFGGPLDLVIDDASHLVTESRVSFNTLFPRLRPGGIYLVEDWSWAHRMGPEFLPGHAPLSLFLFELIVACAHIPELIEHVEVGPDVFTVRRGPAPLRPGAFDLSDHFDPRALDLLPKLGAPG